MHPPLPPVISGWFASKGWQPFPHQLDILTASQAQADILLLAPTGSGKTMAGFLPTLAAFAGRERTVAAGSVHTLYLSPLRALTYDIQRNLEGPVAEMGLPVRIETRTGDTGYSRKKRQLAKPPDILLTTPESLALLLSYPESRQVFAGLERLVIDEIHSLAPSKRGDLAALCLTELRRIAPAAHRLGLSATAAEPERLLDWLSSGEPAPEGFILRAPASKRPDIRILRAGKPVPWAGHAGVYATGAIMDAIRAHGTTVVFVNTRSQCELMFQALWDINDDSLPIGLHHSSLDREQRTRVERAMAAGELRAVVATSALELGMDWGGVDLVIQVGAPKGISRLLQRIGRSNHRHDLPSKALLVPGNRFEVVECIAAIDAIAEGDLDADPMHPGGIDVLCQFLLNHAIAEPLVPARLYEQVRHAAPYRRLTRAGFDAALAFVTNGGYALKGYPVFNRLAEDEDGALHPATPAVVRRHRLNIGTIVEHDMVPVRLRIGGKSRLTRDLGKIEEYFISQLQPGETFVFGGRLLRFVHLRERSAIVEEAATGQPKIPSYYGGRMPLSTRLAERVVALLARPGRAAGADDATRDWLWLQSARSELPDPEHLLVECFTDRGTHYAVLYPFAGRACHYTLGFLLTLQLERARRLPLGFSCNEYALVIWGLRHPGDVESLLLPGAVQDAYEDWLADSRLLKRCFKDVAQVSGLIDRRLPGQQRTAKQVSFSSDTIFDVLRQYEPEHILLAAARQEADRTLTDLPRLLSTLARFEGRVRQVELPRASPFSIPLLMEIGRERIMGEGLKTQISQEMQEAEWAHALLQEESR